MLQSRKLYYTLFVLGALYVLFVQQFFQNEASFIFKTPNVTNETEYTFSEDFQELNLNINQDLNLHGVWFKQDTPKALVLLFPDSDIDFEQIEISKNNYYAYGVDVLIAAYRGTAKSSGKAKTESDLYADAQHWYNFAKSQFPEKDILITGQGFGSAVAAQLAGNNQSKVLILENPSYSYGENISKKRFWWLPYSYFTSFPLNTSRYIRQINTEIILIQDQTKRDDENILTDFLKPSDKTYWLENTTDIHRISTNENTLFFNQTLDALFHTTQIN